MSEETIAAIEYHERRARQESRHARRVQNRLVSDLHFTLARMHKLRSAKLILFPGD